MSPERIPNISGHSIFDEHSMIEEHPVDSPASVVLPHERGRLKRNATDFSAKISTLVNASFQDVSSSSRERTARNGFNRNESQSPRGHYARKVDLGSSRPGKILKNIFSFFEFRLELELELGLKLE